MHYYQFNIGDYTSHTSHLEPIEDLAYRRMIDWCYLHEKPLPENVDEIARLIRMRTHCDSIANVLREFFTVVDDGYISQRVEEDLNKYREKSDKARESANARWSKKDNKTKKLHNNANAMRTQCEGNANHKPITNNHKPITNDTEQRLSPAKQVEKNITLKTYIEQCREKDIDPIPENDTVFNYAAEINIPPDWLLLAWLEFVEYYTTDNKGKRYKDWKSVFRKAVRGNWMKIWYIDNDKKYVLTTVGRQAEIKHSKKRVPA